jgi:hypothetical protein
MLIFSTTCNKECEIQTKKYNLADSARNGDTEDFHQQRFGVWRQQRVGHTGSLFVSLKSASRQLMKSNRLAGFSSVLFALSCSLPYRLFLFVYFSLFSVFVNSLFLL